MCLTDARAVSYTHLDVYKRQVQIYGSETLEMIEKRLYTRAEELGVALSCFQSNHEGAIIDRLHEAKGKVDGVILNAGAYTHYSCLLYTSRCV